MSAKGLLSFYELCELAATNVITETSVSRINSASIDITLGRYLLIERRISTKELQLNKKDKLEVVEYDLRKGSYTMAPGEFLLASSEQQFNLPSHISAEYKLKSSMARIGLEHLNAGWCDAGWHGSVLTLELCNITRYHYIRLCEGDAIGQVVFFEHTPVPTEASYATRGSYNNDTTVTGVKVK